MIRSPMLQMISNVNGKIILLQMASRVNAKIVHVTDGFDCE